MSDLKEKLNGLSTVKKGIVGFIAICCIGIILMGIIGSGTPDKNTSTDTVDNSKTTEFSENDSSSENTKPSSPLQVRITTDGAWSGAIGSGTSTSSYDGNGDKTIDIEGSSFDMVSATIQKKGGGSGELKVEILKDGEVVKESSTNAEYGVVSIVDWNI